MDEFLKKLMQEFQKELFGGISERNIGGISEKISEKFLNLTHFWRFDRLNRELLDKFQEKNPARISVATFEENPRCTPGKDCERNFCENSRRISWRTVKICSCNDRQTIKHCGGAEKCRSGSSRNIDSEGRKREKGSYFSWCAHNLAARGRSPHWGLK